LYFFLKRWKFFKNNFFLVGFASSIKNFGCAMACAVFYCACKIRSLFFYF